MTKYVIYSRRFLLTSMLTLQRAQRFILLSSAGAEFKKTILENDCELGRGEKNVFLSLQFLYP